MVTAELGVPLLIVNGNFQNLNIMTVEELETFIPFMAKCSVTKGGAVIIDGRPAWWLKTIPYKFPLKKPKGLSEIGYRRHLQAMVCQCYCYHNAHFLLSFCSKIYKNPETIFLRNNEDNTTSVFLVENAAHLLTFDNENKDYDSKCKGKPNWRNLLPSQSNICTPPVLDIYLCENCGVEFYSYADIQRHEKECYGSVSDSDDIQIITHIKPLPLSPTEQNGFLNYFELCSKSSVKQKLDEKPTVRTECKGKRWVVLNMCLQKNGRIEFSSLLGRKMLEKQSHLNKKTKVLKSIMINEGYCCSQKRGSKDTKTLRPRITFRRPKNKEWCHTYCFNKRQRNDKMKTFITGLNKRSRKLLRKCREVRVALPRLNIAKADYYVISSLGDSFYPIMKNSIEEDLYECGVLYW